VANCFSPYLLLLGLAAPRGLQQRELDEIAVRRLRVDPVTSRFAETHQQVQLVPRDLRNPLIQVLYRDESDVSDLEERMCGGVDFFTGLQYPHRVRRRRSTAEDEGQSEHQRDRQDDVPAERTAV